MDTPRTNGHYTGLNGHGTKPNGQYTNGHDKTAQFNQAPSPNVEANDNLEQLLLAALLRDNARLADIGALTTEHFARDLHGRLFELIRALVADGLPATPQTMKWMVKGDKALAGHVDYLRSLVDSAVSYTPHAVQHYAQQLITLHCRRRIVDLINDVPRILDVKDWSYAVQTEALRSEFDTIFGDWQRAIVPVSKVLARLDFSEPLIEEPHQWLVDGWLPMHETCGLAGTGARGKTQLVVQLATAAALGGGVQWVGLPVTGMKAACLLCEDSIKDAVERQIRINKLYGCSTADLKDKLLILPRREHEDNYLAKFEDDEMILTPFFEQLLNTVKEFGARLLVIDTREDTFFGDQNNPIHSRRFVRGCCDKIAREIDGVVVLIYHPSIRGMHDGDMQSGSVQWNAAFRARLTLTAPIEKEDDDTDKTLSLSLVKANYGDEQTFKIQWRDGALVRKPEAIDAADAPAYQYGADLSKWCRVFLQLLGQYTQQGRPVSASPAARNFAPKIFAIDPDREGCTKQQLDRAMGALFKREQIAMQQLPGSRSAQLVTVGGTDDH